MGSTSAGRSLSNFSDNKKRSLIKDHQNLTGNAWQSNSTTLRQHEVVAPSSKSILDAFFSNDSKSFKKVEVAADPPTRGFTWFFENTTQGTTLSSSTVSDHSFLTKNESFGAILGPDQNGGLLATSAQPTETTIHCEGTLCLNLLGDWDVWYNITNDTDFDYSSESDPPVWRWEVLLLFGVVLLGIMGNMLVCIAISVEKKLQNVTNYFLMSLAIADLFVSLIVMPCSIAHEFVGYWPFGFVMCDIWQVSDVMMCTSSIMHMCTISLDRYMGIKNPLKLRNKSKTVVGIKILLVWFISLAIASPLIFLGIFRPQEIYWEKQCAIFNRYFLIYGSLGAFFIPLIIMLVAYSLTIHILNKQAKKCAQRAKQGLRRSTTRRKPADTKSATVSQHRATNRRGFPKSSNGVSIARKLQTHLDQTRAHPSEVQPLAGKDKAGYAGSSESLETISNNIQKSRPASNQFKTVAQLSGVRASLEKPGPAAHSNTEGGKDETTEKFRSLVKKHSAAIKVAGILIAKREEKKELNTVKTERKAVKVLGTMFAIFVICWGPFFSINLAMGVCESCNVDLLLFKVFLWLGYISSTLNPIVYTIFNKTFKLTFIRLLTCNHFRSCRNCWITCASKLRNCKKKRNQKIKHHSSHMTRKSTGYKYSGSHSESYSNTAETNL